MRAEAERGREPAALKVNVFHFQICSASSQTEAHTGVVWQQAALEPVTNHKVSFMKDLLITNLIKYDNTDTYRCSA